jgi:hypothetical protein
MAFLKSSDKFIGVLWLMFLSCAFGAYIGSEIRLMQHEIVERGFSQRLQNCNEIITR